MIISIQDFGSGMESQNETGCSWRVRERGRVSYFLILVMVVFGVLSLLMASSV